eukprot:124768-Rhodomonas_salina.1
MRQAMMHCHSCESCTTHFTGSNVADALWVENSLSYSAIASAPSNLRAEGFTGTGQPSLKARIRKSELEGVPLGVAPERSSVGTKRNAEASCEEFSLCTVSDTSARLVRPAARSRI